MEEGSSYALRAPAKSVEDSASIVQTAHILGVHDSLRYGGPRSLAAEEQAVHPLQTSLEQYDSTQQQLKLRLQRNIYGLHAPVRSLMEREVVSTAPHFVGVGQRSNVHLEILLGKDEEMGVPDVLGIDSTNNCRTDFHREMERQKRI